MHEITLRARAMPRRLLSPPGNKTRVRRTVKMDQAARTWGMNTALNRLTFDLGADSSG